MDLKTVNIFNFVKKGIFYCFSLGAEAIISVVLLPVLTKRITPADYGIWILFVALVSFTRPVLNLMLQDVIRMKYFNTSRDQLLVLIQAGIVVPLILCLIFTIITAFIPEQIQSLFAFPGDFFWSVLVFAGLQGFYYLVLALMQFKEKHNLFLLQQVLQAVITVGLSLILLNFNLSWHAPVYARIIALFLVNGLGLVWIYKNYGSPFSLGLNFQKILDVTLAGLRFVPVGLAGVMLPFTNRLLVTKLISSTETSYLGIGNLFSMTVILGTTGFIYAWQPKYFQALQNQEENPTLKYFSAAFFLGVPCFALIMAICGLYIAPYLINYDIALVKPYIIFFIIAAVFEGYYQHNYTILQAQQRVTLIAIIAIAVIILNFLSAWFLVGKFGGIGAAYATCISYICAVIFSSIFIVVRRKN